MSFNVGTPTLKLSIAGKDGAGNLVAVAEHRDEGFVDVRGKFFEGRHQHRFYMPWTPDGRLCAKGIHGGPLWNKLNADYPAFMREHGFDVSESLILDYDEVLRIDDAIKKADTQEEVEALEAEKQALRDEANEERTRRRAERKGLPYGIPAREYKRYKESEERLVVAEEKVAKAQKDFESIEGFRDDAEKRLESVSKEIEEKSGELDDIEITSSRRRSAIDESLETYKSEREAEIDSDIAAEKQRRIDEAVGFASAALAARERALAEDEEELEGREKAVSERAAALDAKQASLDQREETHRNHMHKEYVKAMGAAADAEKLVGQLNGLMDTYESAIEAAEKRALPKDVDDVVWQLKRIKSSEKSLERYPNAKSLFDVYLGMAQGPGGRAFQERHHEFVHSRGTVNDAEARVQEIIKRAADGKKSRGFEVGE